MEPGAAGPVTSPDHDVELSGVAKRFGATEVLRDIDLQVGRGLKARTMRGYYP